MSRTTTGRPTGFDRGCVVADVVYVLMTLVVFGLLALVARGAEKL